MNKSEKERIFENVLRRRRERLRVPKEQILQSEVQRQSPDANILANDLARLRGSVYPTAGCLSPDETKMVREEGQDAIPEQRLRHVRECTFCAALLKGKAAAEAGVAGRKDVSREDDGHSCGAAGERTKRVA